MDFLAVLNGTITPSYSWLWWLLKGGLMVAFSLYLLFALVVLMQIKQMVATLRVGFNTVLVILGWLHLLAAGLVWLMMLIIL